MGALDVGEQDFAARVLDRSQSVPVVVDFWAPWCGPCRLFGPVIEQAAAARAELLDLVKIDAEANPRLAAYFNVHGIPAVKAFRRREVVAQFVGARSPSQVAGFMDDLAPSEIDQLVADGSEAALRRAVELDPRRTDGAVGLARMLHERGESAAALALLVPVAGAFRADGLAARIRLDDARPELAARIAAGCAALDRGDLPGGLGLLLDELPRAGGHVPAVRQLIRSVLDSLGFGDPLADEMRRRLAA